MTDQLDEFIRSLLLELERTRALLTARRDPDAAAELATVEHSIGRLEEQLR